MSHRPNRRDALRLGVLGALGAGLWSGPARATAALPTRFTTPLRIPAVKTPTRRTATTDYYDMTIQESEAQILPGPKTAILGYDGLFPGPTVKATRGRPVVIRQHNMLTGQEAVVHLHGGIDPHSEDGYPMDAIAPGDYRDYHYSNDQPAATLWYHDHTHMMEAEMVFRGLSGCYLLADPQDAALDLPCGRHDIPIMLRDARFDSAGQFDFVLGDFSNRKTVLVNGNPQPFHPVEARKYRLRLLNGSNMRYFTLRLSTGDPLVVVASDDGLLPGPLPADSVELSPGERVDVVVDFAEYPPGTRVVLVNSQELFSDEARNILCFVVGEPAPDPSRVPADLAPRADLGTPTATRTFNMNYDWAAGAYVINGQLFDADRVDERIQIGATEIWEVHNGSFLPVPVPHNFHLHGTHFQILDRDGKAVTGHETGPKDTVAVPVGSTVRLKVRYDRYLGLYLYHCHLLDHSSMGMMAQLEVTP